MNNCYDFLVKQFGYRPDDILTLTDNPQLAYLSLDPPGKKKKKKDKKKKDKKDKKV